MRFVASLLFIALIPVLILISVGILLSSRGSIFYLADRAGLYGSRFKLVKFRTMRENKGPEITSSNDERVFKFGKFLRKTKLDEIPQLINIVKGEMSFFGPRPESTYIVSNYYTDEYLQTLNILPGLVSPGSLFNYTHGDSFLLSSNPDKDYVENFLPLKMKLELNYLKQKSLFFDLRLMLKTIYVIGLVSLGKKNFKDPTI